MPSKYSAPKFTFADLFAGIGGMRIAFEKAQGACVLTSEIDRHALITYQAQKWKKWDPPIDHTYINDVVELGELPKNKIPDFDVMVAGFPCQPYSIAGLRQGLSDEKGRGQVFLSMLDILAKKQPKAFLLENVRGMMSHDGGRTIEFMINSLRESGKTGYTIVEPMVLNSMIHGGVPQNRERVFIIGFRSDLDIDPSAFHEPRPLKDPPPLQRLIYKSDVPEKYFYTAEKYDCFAEIEKVVTRSDTAYQWRRVYVRENKSGVCPALTANMGSGGHNVPLVKVGSRIRKLTPKECARLQGFDVEKFVFPDGMADVHLYHQFGNSVTVPLITRLAKAIAKVLES
jgi:DNA (cytosine-5)-methyltransferase 1